MNKRRLISTISITLIAFGALLANATAADAATPTPQPAPASSNVSPQALVPAYTWKVINSSYVGNHKDLSDVIARCYATGGTCNIAVGHTATTTIQTSLGMSRDGVASGLSISSASSISLTVGCTSPILASGQAWTAYPIGRYYTYQVQEYSTVAGSTSVVGTSGLLHAFSAYNNQIYCQ